VSASLPLFLAQFVHVFIFIAAPLILIAAGLAAWQLSTGGRPPLIARLVCLVVIAVGWSLTIITMYLTCKALLGLASAEFRVFLTSGILVIFAFALMIVVAMRRRRQTQLQIYTTSLVAAALMMAALYRWDVRTPWEKFVESPQPIPASLATFVPQNASVYWEGGLEMLWFRLRRPSYFSCEQGTGSIFHRGTAMAFWHRAQTFWNFRTADYGPTSSPCPVMDANDDRARNRDGLQSVCRREPSLDYLVLTRPVVDLRARKTWLSPASVHEVVVIHGNPAPFDTNKFYLYSCADVR
jgi:hypothetical protein